MLSKSIVRVLFLLLAIASQACVTYSGVAKDNKGQVYLTGSTTYLIFSNEWVKRCKEIGVNLKCEEIDVWDGEIPYGATSSEATPR